MVQLSSILRHFIPIKYLNLRINVWRFYRLLWSKGRSAGNCLRYITYVQYVQSILPRRDLLAWKRRNIVRLETVWSYFHDFRRARGDLINEEEKSFRLTPRATSYINYINFQNYFSTENHHETQGVGKVPELIVNNGYIMLLSETVTKSQWNSSKGSGRYQIRLQFRYWFYSVVLNSWYNWNQSSIP